jgi:hypothetical protein
MPTRKSQSDVEPTAQEQLDEMQGEGGRDVEAELTDQAREQKKQQAEELSAGRGNVSKADRALAKLVEKAPAGARVGHEAGTPTVLGKMDNMSVRSNDDALEGHFVTIDANADGVEEAFEAAGLEEHNGYYGVYLYPASTDTETGVPDMAVVRLRDDTNALVKVPYESLSRGAAGGR